MFKLSQAEAWQMSKYLNITDPAEVGGNWDGLPCLPLHVLALLFGCYLSPSLRICLPAVV
jgi:hypothetical protein